LSIGAAGKTSAPKPETNPGTAPKTEDEKWPAKLEEGRTLLQGKGNQAEAISRCFDPIIAHFEAAYKNSTNKIYCAADPQTTLTYLLSAAADDAIDENKEVAEALKNTFLFSSLKTGGRNVVVLSETWAEAHYLKAYACVELGLAKKAKAELKRALDLSPLNAIYWAELGHVLQMEKNWPKAMKAFQKSEEAAAFSADEYKNHDLARAWRGIGYCLTETGKIKEAEKQYRKCLELDADDKMAISELQYLRGLLKQN
jgi:tetratricopeptide (TPR) repeat protein